MATIYKRGSKWRAQIRRKWHPAQSEDFQSKAESKAWAKRVEGRMDSGARQEREANGASSLRPPVKPMPLSEALKLYLRTITPTKRGAKQERSRSQWLAPESL
jgi:hypothetical protein